MNKPGRVLMKSRIKIINDNSSVEEIKIKSRPVAVGFSRPIGGRHQAIRHVKLTRFVKTLGNFRDIGVI